LASTLAIAILQLTHQLTAQVGPSKGGSGNPAAEQPGAATTVGADKASATPAMAGSKTDLAANAFTGAGANPAVPLANSLLAELQSPEQTIAERSIVSGAGASATPATADTKNSGGIFDTMYSKATDVSTTQAGSTTISGPTQVGADQGGVSAQVPATAAASTTSESVGAASADTSQTDQ